MHTREYEEHGFDAMGTQIHFWIDRAAGGRVGAAFRAGETFMRDFDRRLSRFNPDSELCALNSAETETVEISTLMVRLVEAALEAARVSDGLVDPTLVAQLEDAGYRNSRAGQPADSISRAMANRAAPVPAAASPQSRWREISVDRDARTVTRPVGVRIDSGGSGKGLAADMLAALWTQLLPAGTAFIVDCGGDMRVGALDELDDPYEIRVESRPALAEQLTLEVRSGGVATSGIGSRLWSTGGGWAHHLIDPATGQPAWTGVASATATGPTALAAETTAKVALLRGARADGSPELPGLQVTVGFDGSVARHGELREAAAA